MKKVDVIYMRMKNDISFILDCQMNLFEHQSTDNANMPLRGLLYFARQYEKQLNINHGHNKEIMEKCRVLSEYAVFIGKVREYQKNMAIEKAVDRAVNECIEEGILQKILISHRAEVKDMILTEYDEEKTMRLFQKEYEEEAAEKIAKVKEEAAKEVAHAKEEMVHAKEKMEKAQEEALQTREENSRLQMEIEALKKQLEQARN